MNEDDRQNDGEEYQDNKRQSNQDDYLFRSTMEMNKKEMRKRQNLVDSTVDLPDHRR